jgi:hypothetical protein
MRVPVPVTLIVEAVIKLVLPLRIPYTVTLLMVIPVEVIPTVCPTSIMTSSAAPGVPLGLHVIASHEPEPVLVYVVPVRLKRLAVLSMRQNTTNKTMRKCFIAESFQVRITYQTLYVMMIS